MYLALYSRPVVPLSGAFVGVNRDDYTFQYNGVMIGIFDSFLSIVR
jgi:hypothetical protein